MTTSLVRGAGLRTPIGRSENMRRIRSKDTGPELLVRRQMRLLGFTGYRLHRKDLPGRPDVVFVGRRKAVLIHGCFWHWHSCKEGKRKPKTNQDFWLSKITRNRERDINNAQQLRERGWSVLTIWECEIANLHFLSARLKSFLSIEGNN
jgi:DNA mismatch endonuclease (patch repair protein)